MKKRGVKAFIPAYKPQFGLWTARSPLGNTERTQVVAPNKLKEAGSNIAHTGSSPGLTGEKKCKTIQRGAATGGKNHNRHKHREKRVR